MKHKLLLTLALFVAAGMYAQTVPNTSFESWNTSSLDNPQYYPTNSNQQVHLLGLPYNVLKVADPQQGTLAIQMNTVANSTDTAFGFFIDGDPNTFQGGIPYAQHPVSLSGYYKNNEMPGDTGIVVIIFKQGGTPVSMDFAIFTGTHSSYTPFSITLSIPPLANPDTIIFGAASSNGFVTNGIAGSMLQLDNISFTGVASQPAQLNGSFENWINTNTSTPQNWATAGDVTFQTTDAHSGSYALELNTVSFGGQNFTPSYATNGIIPSQAGPQGGRPYSLMSDTLCGWYKFIPSGIDSATVFVQTTNNTSVVGASALGLAPATNYTFFSLPFSSVSQPDTLMLLLISTYGNFDPSNVGSVFKVDDIYLKSSLAGVQEMNWNVFGMMQLYPNPSSTDCWIEFDNAENVPVVMSITDELGKIVSEITINETGHQRQHIDTSLMQKGNYLVTLTQNGKRASRPLLVQ